MSTSERVDPSRDHAVRMRAHLAMSGVYLRMKDILRRYYDDDGMYIEPTGVNDGGDNTGMIYAANNEVLTRLADEVADARSKLMAIFDEIDAYKREQYGPGYNPAPRKL